MKKMKTFCSICMSMIVLMAVGTTSFAAESFPSNKGGTVNILYDDTDNNTYQPYTTVPGNNGGSSSINWVSRGQINWRINPGSNDPWTFVGTITFKNMETNKNEKTLYVSGGGVGYKDYNEYFGGLTKGVTYLATPSGGGTIGIGVWIVAPHCHEAFYMY